MTGMKSGRGRPESKFMFSFQVHWQAVFSSYPSCQVKLGYLFLPPWRECGSPGCYPSSEVLSLVEPLSINGVLRKGSWPHHKMATIRSRTSHKMAAIVGSYRMMGNSKPKILQYMSYYFCTGKSLQTQK